LDGPRAKLARAYEHLLTLDVETGAFFAAKPYEVVPEFDANVGAHILRVRIREPPPLRLGAILGDFAQNTRNALDHLVWQLALLNGKRPNSKVAFPIWRTAAEATPGEIQKRLGKLSDAHRALIESAQPHHAANRSGDHILALLAWLSNTDKHRVIHPVNGYMRGDFLPSAILVLDHAGQPIALPGNAIWVAATGRRLHDGTELMKIPVPEPDAQVYVQAQPAFEIAFGDQWMRAGVVTTIYELVRQTVEHFAPDFP